MVEAMKRYAFTLTPCFSWVISERHNAINRFNGFPEQTVETVWKSPRRYPPR